jgi:hypothetical protein
MYLSFTKGIWFRESILSKIASNLLFRAFTKIFKLQFNRLKDLNFFKNLTPYSLGIKNIFAKFNLAMLISPFSKKFNHGHKVTLDDRPESLIEEEGETIRSKGPFSIGPLYGLLDFFLKNSASSISLPSEETFSLASPKPSSRLMLLLGSNPKSFFIEFFSMVHHAIIITKILSILF